MLAPYAGTRDTGDPRKPPWTPAPWAHWAPATRPPRPCPRGALTRRVRGESWAPVGVDSSQRRRRPGRNPAAGAQGSEVTSRQDPTSARPPLSVPTSPRLARPRGPGSCADPTAGVRAPSRRVVGTPGSRASSVATCVQRGRRRPAGSTARAGGQKLTRDPVPGAGPRPYVASPQPQTSARSQDTCSGAASSFHGRAALARGHGRACAGARRPSASRTRLSVSP